MRGTKAKQLRKLAAVFARTDHGGKSRRSDGSIRWDPMTFKRLYRDLKKDYHTMKQRSNRGTGV
jgi:hypothetical protein